VGPSGADTSKVRTRSAVSAAALVLVGSLASIGATSAAATQSLITTVAGGAGFGRATTVAQGPTGLAVAGDLLTITDFRSGFGGQFVNTVRVLDLRTGTERVVAGNGNYGGRAPEGIPATSARLSNPLGPAVDSRGRTYFAERDISVVRMVDAAGIMTTVAGGAPGQYDVGDGRLATEAFLYSPSDVEVDGADNLYIADTNAHRVRKIDAATGIITTVAGSGQYGFSGDGGPATAADVSTPTGLAVDRTGNLYFADAANARVRKVDATGVITTVAGGGPLEPGSEGPATQVTISPGGVAVDAAGTVHFTDSLLVRKIDSTGTLRTVAGNGTGPFAPDGDAGTVPENVPARASPLYPSSLVFDGSGNLYVGDFLRVRRVDPAGIITTVAGNGRLALGGDGDPAVGAQMLHPSGMILDRDGNMYVADANNRVRRVSASGIITSAAGLGRGGGLSGDGGPATAAEVGHPVAFALDHAGNLFVSDSVNGRIRKIDTSGIITTVAGGGWDWQRLGDGGPAVGAYLSPSGITFDAAGNLYIADGGNRIRRVDTSGIITTVVGGVPAAGIGDGGPASDATLYGAIAVQFDPLGRMLILEGQATRVRRVDLDGIITTIAGNGRRGFSGDGGPATAAVLNLGGWSGGLTVDASGNVFIADTGNYRVRKINADGIITTIAGSGYRGVGGDGGPATEADFDVPIDVALDRAGNLYVSDADNNRIRKVTGAGGPPAAPTTVPGWLRSTATTSTTSTSTSTTSTTSTTVPSRVSLQNPYSVWAQPAPTALDGMGTWLVPANDPVAGTGQAAAAYVYGQVLWFTGSSAVAILGLTTGPAGKTAVWTVKGPDGRSHDASVPFNWTAGSAYFVWVYRFSPGVWGAYAYDATAKTSTPIGQLTLPDAWGKLSPTSVTTVGWLGSAASACSAYPYAEVFVYPAIGFVGTTPTVASLAAKGSGVGDCPTQTSIEPGVWARSRVGAPAP